jgi:hypothetical protein
MEFGKAENETGMDDETVGLGMIGSSSGKVRGEVADSKSKGQISSFLIAPSVQQADICVQPNYQEQIRSELKCWVDQPNHPMPHRVYRLRFRLRLCRVLRLSRQA